MNKKYFQFFITESDFMESYSKISILKKSADIFLTY